MKFNTLVALFATASAVKIAQNDEADMEDHVEENPVEDETIDAEAQEPDAMAEKELNLPDEYDAYNIPPLLLIDQCYKFINRGYNMTMRHQGYRLKIHKLGHSSLENKDSTF
jgi:hypothetical protein